MKKKKREHPEMAYKYSTKKLFSRTYLVLISLCILLTLGRWYSVFNHDFVLLNAEIHSHISNLSLSMIAYTGIGYSWLLSGMKFRFIIALGALLIAGNFVCETLMGFMNTADIIDAIYGTAGVLAAYLFLFFTNKYGLVKRSSSEG